MDVIVTSNEIRRTSLNVDLDSGLAQLGMHIERQGDRYRRVVITVKGKQEIAGYLLEPTYLDLQTGERRTPLEQARATPGRMHAHTLHGSDVRRLTDAGQYDFQRSRVIG